MSLKIENRVGLWTKLFSGVILALIFLHSIPPDAVAEDPKTTRQYRFKPAGIAPPTIELSRIRELRSKETAVDVTMVIVPDKELFDMNIVTALEGVAKDLTRVYKHSEAGDSKASGLTPTLASLLDFIGTKMDLQVYFDNNPARAAVLRSEGYFASNDAFTRRIGGDEGEDYTFTRWIKRDEAEATLLGTADLKLTLTPNLIVNHSTAQFRARYTLAGKPKFSGSPMSDDPQKRREARAIYEKFTLEVKEDHDNILKILNATQDIFAEGVPEELSGNERGTRAPVEKVIPFTWGGEQKQVKFVFLATYLGNVVHQPLGCRLGDCPEIDRETEGKTPTSTTTETVEVPRPDGSTDTVTLTEKKYDDGTRRVEMENDRGPVAEVVVDPDGKSIIVTTDEWGNPVKIEGDPAQDIVTVTGSDGRKMTGRPLRQQRDGPNEGPPDGPADGLSVENADDEGGTVTVRPDGSIAYTDGQGRIKEVRMEEDGSTVTTVMDTDGDYVEVVRDPSGNILTARKYGSDPQEPGREYYENVLGGTEWDLLPKSTKIRYAYSERVVREGVNRRLTEDLRQEEAEKREEIERLRQTEVSARREKEAAAARAAQEKADKERVQLEEKRRRRQERQRAIQESYDTADRLENMWKEAEGRGDAEEMRRIQRLQDGHHEASMELLQFTSEEEQEMERLSAVRHELAQRVNSAAMNEAAGELVMAAGVEDVKKELTDTFDIISFGANFQKTVHETNRRLESEEIKARHRIEVINRFLGDPELSSEQRGILEEMRDFNESTQASASSLLMKNGVLTTVGYGFDAAVLFGTAGLGTAAKGIVGAGRAAGATAARAGTGLMRAATLAAQEGSTSAALMVKGVGMAKITGTAVGNAARAIGARTVQPVAEFIGKKVVEPAVRVAGPGTPIGIDNAKLAKVIFMDVGEAAGRLSSQLGKRIAAVTGREPAAAAGARAAPVGPAVPGESSITVIDRPAWLDGAPMTGPTGTSIMPAPQRAIAQVNPLTPAAFEAAMNEARVAATAAREAAEAEAIRLRNAGQQATDAGAARMRGAIISDNLQVALDNRILEAQFLGVPPARISELVGDPNIFSHAEVFGRHASIRALEEEILTTVGLEIVPPHAATPVRRLAVRARTGAAGADDIAQLRTMVEEAAAEGGDAFERLARQGSMNSENSFVPLVSEEDLFLMRRLAQENGIIEPPLVVEEFNPGLPIPEVDPMLPTQIERAAIGELEELVAIAGTRELTAAEFTRSLEARMVAREHARRVAGIELAERQRLAPEFNYPQVGGGGARLRRHVVPNDNAYIQSVMGRSRFAPTQNDIYVGRINEYVQTMLDGGFPAANTGAVIELLPVGNQAGRTAAQILAAPQGMRFLIAEGHHRIVAAQYVHEITGRPLFVGENAIIPAGQVRLITPGERAISRFENSWRSIGVREYPGPR